MRIFEALNEMRRGKIAKCKHSYFALDEMGYLVRINKKDCSVIGIATVHGDIFATEDWEVFDKETLLKGKLKWMFS